ncbi:glycoside hydrolase family 38 C-terminal domain-containing protein [Candidatus Cyanaurora vandensis]|uniref:alpha-mannosidase n=1 Tax=Candidatus Cyanaurora vandensis TaxID=2714958 RepID=UPI00257FD3BC|nr:glycoside hydrolase family 38 C-terminal domain-containing protein [Candidatus Cyanaurora vandensis]
MDSTLARLRAYVNQVLLTGWYQDDGTEHFPNEKQHLAWTGGGVPIRLHQTVRLGADWRGYPVAGRLYLQLYWWARVARVYVDGQLVLSGDLFDQRGRVLLTQAAQPGQEFQLTVYLESPGHDGGALYKVALYLENPDPQWDPGYFADELAGLRVLDLAGSVPLLAAACAVIRWLPEHALSELKASFSQARTILQPLVPLVKAYRVNLLGHSHIDLAWLWPHAETLDVSERTFQSVLALQEDYPELRFVQSTAYLYEWLETHRPELFAQIQARITSGQWEVVGGMWVEPDLNLPDGESLIRQVVYGKQYFRKLGVEVEVGWNPDSFGYTAQLPQIYQKSGIRYFLTQKLLWNDTTQFPHQRFWWQGPDGSRVLTYFAPPLGEEIPPVKVLTHLKNSGQPELLWLYGVGDHGGGPTKEMMASQQRWRESDFCPTLSHSSSLDFFQGLPTADLPVWTGELYLEFHRGCYTSHADQKRFNRQAEVLLTNCEKLLFLLALQGHECKFEGLERCWKLLLFNQFHDILPGTAIPEVFVQANRDWAELFEQGEKLLTAALAVLIQPTDQSWVVVNLLNWPRQVLVELPCLGAAEDQTALVAVSVPALGWAVCHSPVPSVNASPVSAGFILENDHLRVTLDPHTGNLTSLWDKDQAFEYLTGPSQWGVYRDQGQYWDAWNIDPHYRDHPLTPPVLMEITPVQTGPLCAHLRVVYQLGQSRITQRITLTGRLLTFKTEVDWRERQVLLKVSFPLTLQQDRFWCEVPMAVLARPTHRQTPTAAAQWEVPALRWVAYEADGHGLALLNDSKYGYDCVGSQLSLTLLRAPVWPDPESDQGSQNFTYQLHPYRGSWQSAGVVQLGHELNNPPLVVPGKVPAFQGPLVSPSSLVWVTCKPTAEPQVWILRFYESQGQACTTNLDFPVSLVEVQETDLLEEPLYPLTVNGGQVTLHATPWEIKTLRVVFATGT